MCAEMKDPVACVVLDVRWLIIGGFKWLNTTNWQIVYAIVMTTTPTVTQCYELIDTINEYYLETKLTTFRTH